jgi:hypothetical protein
MYGQLGIAAIVLTVGFSAGWVSNGWRLNEKIATIKADHIKEKSDTIANARLKEVELQEAIATLRFNYDKQLKKINTDLNDALDRLRDRPERVSRPTGTCEGSSGKELSRPDAEFLTRLAAEADKLVTDLQICYKQYDEVRTKILNRK